MLLSCYAEQQFNPSGVKIAIRRGGGLGELRTLIRARLEGGKYRRGGMIDAVLGFQISPITPLKLCWKINSTP